MLQVSIGGRFGRVCDCGNCSVRAGVRLHRCSLQEFSFQDSSIAPVAWGCTTGGAGWGA